MQKLFLKGLRLSILISVVIIISNSANAQMECRSMLGAHLTPFKKDIPILWAIEGTMAPGIMTSPYANIDNAKLNGGMLLGALDFTFLNKHNFYIEGGYKNWKNSELVDDNSKSRNLGLRQIFYSITHNTIKVKIGLHETKLGNFYLIDERILGASVDKEIGAFTLNLRGGTVMKNFARMGQFCSNRHLYGILNSDYTENIGKKPGETNLAGIVVNWNPNFKKEDKNSKIDKEFSNTDEFNEFGSSDDFSDVQESSSKQKFKISNIAFILHNEFGSIIHDNKIYTGSLIDIELPYNFSFQTGGIYQNMKDNNTIVFIAALSKNLGWNNGSNTTIKGAFIGKANIDTDAKFQPLFSNLFLGEIMRLDAIDFPLWQSEVKHNFTGKLKFHIALKAVGQIEDSKTNEQDLELGIKTFNNHLKLTAIFSRVETLAFPDDLYMAKMEMRVAF
ncbi:MAG: hypothetical protein K8R41_10155 [Bacteroidales bacterium]|nr:hypothetical protein [Bacteroidales bacterium]